MFSSPHSRPRLATRPLPCPRPPCGGASFGLSRIALLLALSLLSACADMGGIAPQARMQSADGIVAARLSTAPAPATDAWWARWDDPQLNRLIVQAVAGNPTLRGAQHRIDQAKAVTALVDSGTLPTLSANADLRRERFSENHVFPPPLGGTVYWNNAATLNLSYDLDLWGKQEHLLAAAVDETHVAEMETREVQLALINAVVQTYVQLADEYAQLDLSREEQARIETGLSLARRRQQAGLGAGQEVDGIKPLLARQQARIETLETALTLTRHQLAALVGLGPQAGASISRPRLATNLATGLATHGSAGPSSDLPAHLPAELIGQRPDVVAQRWRVEAAGERIDAAKAAFYPNIDLMAFAGIQALGFTHFLSGGSGIQGFGPALSLPIFDGGRRRGRLSLETSTYDAAVEAYNATLVHALQQVADHLAQLDSNQRETHLARDALTAAQRRQSAAEKAWQAGVSPFKEVLEAQAVVINGRQALSRLESSQRQLFAGLMFALGGQGPQGATSTQP